MLSQKALFLRIFANTANLANKAKNNQKSKIVLKGFPLIRVKGASVLVTILGFQMKTFANFFSFQQVIRREQRLISARFGRHCHYILKG